MGIRWDEPAHCLNERCFQDTLVGRVEIAMRWIGGFQTYHASCCDAFASLQARCANLSSTLQPDEHRTILQQEYWKILVYWKSTTILEICYFHCKF